MREWLYNILDTNTDYMALMPGGLWQGESLVVTPSQKPFTVYTIGNSTDEQLSDDPQGPERQFFQIYIHDEGGDYTRIDDAVWLLRQILEGASSADYGILQVYHLETSRDLDDSTMNTILRYVRFQAVRMRRTP